MARAKVLLKGTFFLISFVLLFTVGLLDSRSSRIQAADSQPSVEINLENYVINKDKEQKIEVICDRESNSGKQYKKEFKIGNRQNKRFIIPKNYSKCRIIKK